MADTLRFGPEWLRALSGGGSASSGVPSTSIMSPTSTQSAPAGFPVKFKLAENRYGREEMLALFMPKPTVPEELRAFPMIVSEQCLEPVAFIDMTEEEQALLSQSVNSFRTQQQFHPRMSGPASRARGSDRGRGRGGRGGLFPGKGNEFESDGSRMSAFMRPRLGRPDGWDDGEKRFDRPDRIGDRAAGLNASVGLGSTRSGFASADDRVSGQSSPRRDFSRSLSNDSWRETKTAGIDAEKDREWRRVGPTPLAGARPRPGAPWRDRGFDDRPGDPFSGPRQHSSYERGVSGEGGGEDDLPEWAVDEPNEGEIPAGGTFDATGQFMPLKDSSVGDAHRNDNGNDACADDHDSDVVVSSAVASSSSQDAIRLAERTDATTPAEPCSPGDSKQLPNSASSLSKERLSPRPVTAGSSVADDMPKEKRPAVPAAATVPASPGLSQPSATARGGSTQVIETAPAAIEVASDVGKIMEPTIVQSLPPVPFVNQPTTAVAPPSLRGSQEPSAGTAASTSHSVDKSQLLKDSQEADFEHFQKAAEALVETLDDDSVSRAVVGFQPVVHQSKVPAAELLAMRPAHNDLKPDSSYDQWFYKDPQGAIQGPFTRFEMAEWFNAGYFNMALFVRRACDDVFQPLGEIIKRFNRVPFESGSHPPPLKEFVLDAEQQQQRALHYAVLQQQQAVAAMQQQAAASAAIQQQVATARQTALNQYVTILQGNENFKHLPPHQQQQFASNLLSKQYQQQQSKALPSGASSTLTDGRLSGSLSLADQPVESLWGSNSSPAVLSPSPLLNAHAGTLWKPSINAGKAATPTVMGVQSVWELEQQQHEQKLRETEEKRREIERQLRIQKEEEEKRRREVEEDRRRRAEAEAERLAVVDFQQRRQQQAIAEERQLADLQRRQQEQRQAEMQRQELQRQEMQRQELQRQELQRQEMQRQEMQRQEMQRQEMQRQEIQRQEIQRQEIQRQEIQRQEIQRQEIQRQVEMQRQVERQAEMQRQAELRQAEMQRLAEMQRQAESQRQTEAQRPTEAQRQTEAQRLAEAQRQADAQRQAEIQRRVAAQQQQQQSQVKLPSTVQWAKTKPGPTVPTMVGAPAAGQQLSLAQIQEQEERERQQRQMELMRQQQQQEAVMAEAARQQQNKSWVQAATASAGFTGTKSLREIQEEEKLRQQQQVLENSRQQQNTAAGRLSSASAASGSGSARPVAGQAAWDGVWSSTRSAASSVAPQNAGAWDKQVSSSGKVPQALDTMFPSLGVVSAGTTATTKPGKPSSGGSTGQGQKTKQTAAGTGGKTKEEDAVSKLFSWSSVVAQSGTPSDDFMQWCVTSLRVLNDSLDAPFLANYLSGVESAEEVQEIVQSYCGNSGAVQSFVKNFLQRRGRRGRALDDEASLWEVKPTQSPAQSFDNGLKQQQYPGGSPPDRPSVSKSDSIKDSTSEGAETGEKKSKSKKKKMLKVENGALLCFNVQPSSQRFNVGEIDKAD